ncbi:gluconolaconase [Spirosoma sp. 209]|uniref:gluconolaconase n=1 Tax=Spirosoma sp. 209 TaxID=1955701 RepID=UPI00098D47A7|nr:gluconolaconase [Spirosoma sp. 209]
MFRYLLRLPVLFLAGMWACNTPDSEFDAAVFPERIAFQADRLYPEGITYSPALDRFLVSSITQGKIGTVDLNGRYADFLTDTGLISGIGLKIRGNLLYVCNADQGVSTKSTVQTTLRTAGLLVFNLTTRARVQAVRLDSLLPGVPHFANDLAFDPQGNAYITDSFAPVIYRVTPDYKPAIFINSPLFAGAQGFNLNGIVYHPGGYLIVVKSNEGKLFKVSVANPNIITEITGVTVAGGDGLTLLDNDLYVVNERRKVSRLRSTDDWKTATLVSADTTGYEQATTSVAVGSRIYTLNARIGEVSAAAGNPAQLQARDYSIQQFRPAVPIP